MNHPSPQRLTVEEFIVWAMAQPRGRYELEDGRIIEMSPERVGHIKAKLRVIKALEASILKSPHDLFALTDGATVRINPFTAYEPDALVYRGPELPDSAIEVPNPVLVVEVLSPSTSRRDTVEKAENYFKVASVEAYLVVDPGTRSVQVHQREGANVLSDALKDGPIELVTLGLRLMTRDLLPKP